MDLPQEISEQLLGGDDDKVAALVQQALNEGVAPQQILDNGLVAGMTVVGERFKAHEIFLPDVVLAAKAMYVGMDLLKPLLIQAGVPSLGTVVLGSVQGDLHDIGKNLVGIVLKGAGFEIVDLGYDVAPEHFVRTATERGASVIGMSALLTTTMPQMATVVELLRQQDRGATIKTIVGGAPVSEAFARQIGADAYGFDAVNAVERVMSLVDAAGTGERAAATPKKG